jgi:23S rRNA pseudouridine2605 synthase
LQFAKPGICHYTNGMTDISDFTLDKPTAAERIAKRIARAGICSRREAEARITEGRVSVNGKTVYSPALNVSPADKVIIDGKPLPAREPAQLWRYYKPRGLVVSARDEKNRQTIFDTLPAHLPRLISIGRLDMDSEGLLLLTNDGDLARHLELPATGWSRKYRVRLQGKVDETALAQLADGITIDGVRYGSVIARLDRQMPSNAWLTVAIREGKNREVRRIMEHLGYKVGRLIRISYGPFQLGDLAEGAIEQVKARVLADQLGTNPTENAAASKPTLRAKSSAGAGKRHPNKHRPPSGREQSGREQNANNRRPASRHKTGGTRQR